jgi:hypothetical protein
MKKIVIYLFLILFSILSIHAQEHKQVITILDFETSGLSKQEANIILDFLSNYIVETDLFTVIDRMQREAILQELEWSASDCADESCQLELGKLLAANLIIVGSIGQVGNRYILNMKLINVETGVTLRTASEKYADIDLLIDNSRAVVLKLCDAPPPDEGKEIVAAEVSPEAESAADDFFNEEILVTEPEEVKTEPDTEKINILTITEQVRETDKKTKEISEGSRDEKKYSRLLEKIDETAYREWLDEYGFIESEKNASLSEKSRLVKAYTRQYRHFNLNFGLVGVHGFGDNFENYRGPMIENSAAVSLGLVRRRNQIRSIGLNAIYYGKHDTDWGTEYSFLLNFLTIFGDPTKKAFSMGIGFGIASRYGNGISTLSMGVYYKSFYMNYGFIYEYFYLGFPILIWDERVLSNGQLAVGYSLPLKRK